ncbi:hypothetical protein OG738_21475 [Amycolatopsis sp. NBC_01488]|uniref:hypothetical protein n=1 Tax=Amycolatopsis sp. NBC_01488 TaxID=2903563 RepID=UPI002E2BC44E|nr:hypothetical protein [Amycolatopsis sp. NBC_01488]
MTSTENRPQGSGQVKVTAAEKDRQQLDHALDKFSTAVEDLALDKNFDSLEKLMGAALGLKDKNTALNKHFKDRVRGRLVPVVKERLQKDVRRKQLNMSEEDMAKLEKDQLKRLPDAEAELLMRKKVIEVYNSLSGQALIDKVEVIQDGLDKMVKEIPTRREILRKVIEQIETIRQYEFVKGIVKAGGLKFVGDTNDLTALSKQLAAYLPHLDKLAKDIAFGLRHAREGDGRDQERRALVNRTYELTDKYFPNLETLQRSIESALNKLTVEVTTEAINAYVFGTSANVKDIEGLKKAADTGIGLTGSLLKKTNVSGFFVRLASLASSIIATSATAADVYKKRKELGLTQTFGDVLQGFDNDPTLLSARLQANQKAALEILINSLGLTLSGSLLVAPGAAELVMQVWDIVAGAVSSAVGEVLKTRMDKAVEELEKQGKKIMPLKTEGQRESFWASAQDLYKKAYSGVENAVRNAVSEGLHKPAKGAVNKGKTAEEPASELLTTVRQLVDGAVDPQTVTDVLGTSYDPGSFAEGTSASWQFNLLALESMIIRLVMPPVMRQVLKFISVPPAEVLNGGQLAGILDGVEMSQVPAGMLFGQAVQGEPPKAIEGATDLPTRVGARKVKRTNAARSVLTGKNKSYYVSLDFEGVEVWGRYDPVLKTWQASRVDPDSFVTNWPDYTVSRKYVKVGGAKTEGMWYKVNIPDYGWQFLAFDPHSSGKTLWAHRLDTPKGPNGRMFQLGNQVDEFAKLMLIGDFYRAG